MQKNTTMSFLKYKLNFREHFEFEQELKKLDFYSNKVQDFIFEYPLCWPLVLWNKIENFRIIPKFNLTLKSFLKIIINSRFENYNFINAILSVI